MESISLKWYFKASLDILMSAVSNVKRFFNDVAWSNAAARITWTDLPAVTPEREQNDTPGVVGSVVIRVPLGAAEWGFGLTSCWSPTRLLGH